MSGNSFLNAFKVLAKKPMALLLLFPIHAFTPLLLLLLPLLNQVKPISDDAIAAIVMAVLLLAFLLAVLFALARSVLLVSPAMELLRDGAAGVETPAGWFLRGIKKHWWKRGILACAEYSISMLLSFAMQFVTMIPMAIIMIPMTGAAGSGSFGLLITIIVLMYALLILISIVSALVMYVVESLSAFMLVAFADRSFISSFRAIFGKTGRKKFYKLLGGRFVISLLAAILIAFVAFGGFFAAFLAQTDFQWDKIGSAASEQPYSYEDDYTYELEDPFEEFSYKDILPTAIIVTVCWLLYSAMEIYRFAYEFCIFQEVKNKEAAAIVPPATDREPAVENS